MKSLAPEAEIPVLKFRITELVTVKFGAATDIPVPVLLPWKVDWITAPVPSEMSKPAELFVIVRLAA